MEDFLYQIKKEIGAIIKEQALLGSAIVAGYLFGSSITDNARTDSDIDLAFLLDHKAYKLDPLAASAPCYMAATKVGMRLKKETDVIILNASSLEIAYDVVTSGLCFLETDLEKRLDYEIALRGMYFDFKPFLDELRERCISNL